MMRKYGDSPYKVVVVHGGPGAPGSVAPIARELSDYGVLEPFQTFDTISGQLKELNEVINQPVTLIGHSWGAWLSYIFASVYPKLVNKLIMVSSGPFDSKYISTMNSNRNDRLNKQEQERVQFLYRKLTEDVEDKKMILKEFGELMSKADSYSPIKLKNEIFDFNPIIFNNCMNELNKIRKDHTLLNYGFNIKCPVVVIHGVYDSHPFEGVVEPLKEIIDDFNYYLLDKCGHTPWNEVYAKEEFFRIIKNEIK